MPLSTAAKQRAWAAIARSFGIRNALVAIEEGAKVGIGPGLAIAMLEKESGGKNVWGHDPTIFIGGWDAKNKRYWTTNPLRKGYVNQTGYEEYRAQRRQSGNKKRQGVGPMQLTWHSTQDLADARGGCWIPRHNIATGFAILANNIKQFGVRDGIRRYNGSGPAAEAYARDVLAKREKWWKRFRVIK